MLVHTFYFGCGTETCGTCGPAPCLCFGSASCDWTLWRSCCWSGFCACNISNNSPLNTHICGHSVCAVYLLHLSDQHTTLSAACCYIYIGVSMFQSCTFSNRFHEHCLEKQIFPGQQTLNAQQSPCLCFMTINVRLFRASKQKLRTRLRGTLFSKY